MVVVDFGFREAQARACDNKPTANLDDLLYRCDISCLVVDSYTKNMLTHTPSKTCK